MNRRKFLGSVAAWAAGGRWAVVRAQSAVAARCRFGLVTYLWGQDLTLPRLLEVCQQSDVLGVELRTTHRHGVEPDLEARQRQEVKARFEDSPVTLVGLGSNERFDHPDPERVRAAIEATQAFVRLSHDVGGSGVKVKGDQFHDDVPREQTIEQVATALRRLGQFAAQWNQQIRLEVHGGFADLEVHHRIIEAADHPNVVTCWNSNPQDLAGRGLRGNFQLVQKHMGQTAHVRRLDSRSYPVAELIELFVAAQYDGWVLLEASDPPPAEKLVAELQMQRRLFDRYVQQALQKQTAE